MSVSEDIMSVGTTSDGIVIIQTKRGVIARLDNSNISLEERQALGRMMTHAPELINCLLDAQIHVEDCLASPNFKKGVIQKQLNRIRATLTAADPTIQF